MYTSVYQKYKMFGQIKVPTIAYLPNTSVSIGSGGSVLFCKINSVVQRELVCKCNGNGWL